MRHLFFILTTFMILTSCGENLQIDNQSKDPFVISTIEKSDRTGEVQYGARTHILSTHYINIIFFLGKSGEYKIGDTIEFHINIKTNIK